MMKQVHLIFSLVVFAITVNAQVQFSDDFEGFTVGDQLDANSDTWRTWGGLGGGADDVTIVNDNAFSGDNSIRFTAVGAGGPVDIVLPFGDQYASGNFHLDFMINVTEGSSAYYNFQGAVAPGTQWVYNVFFTPDGVINFAEGGNMNVLASTFVPGEWTKMSIDVDLNSNVWSMGVNDVCVGSFQNATNNLASLNLYPTAGDDYYIDDVNMNYSPDGEANTRDGMITVNRALPVGVLNGSIPISGVVSNLGDDVITDFAISYNGLDEFFTETIMPGANYEFTLSASHTVTEGVSVGSIVLSGISDDQNACNNVATFAVRSIDVPRGKRYVVEEATGTWCPWCPRGEVFMNYMNETYSDLFIGIAVHNADPMVVAEYDDSFTSTAGFTGFPTVWTERGDFIDPSGLEGDFVTKVQEVSPVDMELSAEYNDDTRELKMNVNVEALSTVFPSAGIILVLTEDGVTGSAAAGYSQANNYAGGGSGEMGGFELLPNPVPASQMVYNHVARALVNGFQGEEFGAGMVSGDTRTFAYSFTLPETWDAEKMHIVALYRAADGSTPTGAKATIEEAELNPLSSTVDPVLAQNVEVYPNPFSSQANVTLDIDSPENVSIEITDALGRLVSSRDYGVQSGSLTFPVLANQMNDGIYFINILVGDSFTSKRVVISK